MTRRPRFFPQRDLAVTNDISAFPRGGLDADTRTEVGQRTVLAPRPPGGAHRAAVLDQTVAERDPVRFWDRGDQVAFGLHRVGVAGQTQPPREAAHVCIDDHPRRQADDAA